MESSTRLGLYGLPYDLLHWPTSPASNGSVPSKPSIVLLFIPGNPGLAHYYTGWLSSIQSHLPSTTVYAVGHLGHSPSSAAFAWTPKGAASLQDQVEHKVAFIDELSQTHDFGPGKDQTKLVLLGHSIGCWIACEALKLRPALIT